MATAEKPVMVLGFDHGEQSDYALEWTLDHFFVPFAPNFPFQLVIVHAIHISHPFIKQLGPAVAKERAFEMSAERVLDKTQQIFVTKSVKDVVVEVIEGEAHNVLCQTVEKHHASMLVVGNNGYGYGAIKRLFWRGVSDYCAQHAKCSVMTVKKPKIKRS